jgi:hypothetical protein
MEEPTKETSKISSTIFSSTTIFNVAIGAEAQCAAGAAIQENALVACIFSSMAIEALVNEIAEASGGVCASRGGENPKTGAIAEILSQIEAARGSVETKIQMLGWVCNEKMFDRGSNPMQDFRDLIALRNSLVHHKAIRIDVYDDGRVESSTPSVIDRLRSRKLLIKEELNTHYSWVQLVGSAQIAKWACETAFNMATGIVGSLPESTLRMVMNRVHQTFADSLRKTAPSAPAVIPERTLR